MRYKNQAFPHSSRERPWKPKFPKGSRARAQTRHRSHILDPSSALPVQYPKRTFQASPFPGSYTVATITVANLTTFSSTLITRDLLKSMWGGLPGGQASGNEPKAVGQDGGAITKAR